MNECHEPTVGSDARMQIDELETFGLDTAQFLLEIAHLQRHVVDTFTPLFEVARHPGICDRRRHKFNEAVRPSGKRGDSNPLIGQVLFDRLGETEHPVMDDGLIQISHDNSGMVKLEPAER